MRGPSRVPRPLALLLVVALVEALAWIYVLPPLQGPDEVAHMAYVQRIAETGEVPYYRTAPADPGQSYSTELGDASTITGLQPLYGNLSARAPGSPVDERLLDEFEAAITDEQRADGGYTSSMRNPPLFYLGAVPAYLAASRGDVLDRAHAVRLWNVPALLLFVVFTWLLAGELLAGLAAWTRTLATALVVLQPHAPHLTATVNPDMWLAAIWAAALWAGAVVVRRGATRWRVVALAALSVAGALTHGRGIAIAGLALLALFVGWWRTRHPARRTRVLALGAAALASLVVLALSLRYATTNQVSVDRVREFLAYVWNFYLPQLPFMGDSPLADDGWGIRDVAVDRVFGGFAQLEVGFPARAYDVFQWVMVAIGAGGLVGIAVAWWRRARSALVALVVVLAALGMELYLLNLSAWRNISNAVPDPVITGRYLLPFAVVLGVFAAYGLAALPRRLGPVVGACLVAALACVHVAALGLLLDRFYG